MEISLIEFKKYIPKVTLKDDELMFYLKRAKRGVERDGFHVMHKEFDELQRLYALGLMQEDKVEGVPNPSGDVPAGISSIGLSGLSISFKDSNSTRTSSGKVGFFLEYEVLVRKLRGFEGRIA